MSVSPYSARDTGDGAATFAIQVRGALVVSMASTVEVKAEPPLWLDALIWPAFIIGGSLAILRPLKATLIALQFTHRDP